MIDYDRLDLLVDEDPIRLRDEAWREIERLRVKVHAVEAVLRDREAELLKLKGPCSNSRCSLHYAHSGPCDGKGGTADV